MDSNPKAAKLVFQFQFYQKMFIIYVPEYSKQLDDTWLEVVFQCLCWRHQMETLSALLALSEGNSPVTGEFPAQRPVTQSFDVFFYLRLDTHHHAHYDVTVMYLRSTVHRWIGIFGHKHYHSISIWDPYEHSALRCNHPYSNSRDFLYSNLYKILVDQCFPKQSDPPGGDHLGQSRTVISPNQELNKYPALSKLFMASTFWIHNISVKQILTWKCQRVQIVLTMVVRMALVICQSWFV